MILHVLRALFILLMAAAGYYFVGEYGIRYKDSFLGNWAMAVALTIGVLLICIDILAPRKKLIIFSGTFFGLVVGIFIAYALRFPVTMLVDRFAGLDASGADVIRREMLIDFVNLLVGIVCCYLSISFILQTRDDFRFIIPFVEFAKETKGARPILIDTSVLIDGRIADVAETGILESKLVVPRFVLAELQTVADSADKLKRNRGRRGLEVLQRLQGNKKIEIILYDASAHETNSNEGVDERLMVLAQQMNARVLTNDFNLNKVAQLRGVTVINLNDLAAALKPVVLPGEKMKVRLIKPGEEPGQGIGYLEDGTMVVVEQGRQFINEDVEFTVTSVLQTSAGKMIFGRLGDSSPPPRKHRAQPAT
jgi:uncharacterized protein YacL